MRETNEGPPESPTPVVVLVVDDSPDVVRVLADLLAPEGYRVVAASSGAEALAQVDACDPTVVLLDVRLPDMDGFAVCRRLKSVPRTRDVPVLFMSGLEDTRSRLEGFRVGAVDYVAKPFRFEELTARIRTHVDLRRARLDLEAELADRRRIEEALRVSEAKLRAVWDHVPAGIAMIDPQMRVVAMNRQMEAWNPSVDVADRPICWQSFNRPPGTAICPWCPTALTLKDGRVHESVTDTPTPGGVRHFRVVASPVPGAGGTVAGAIELVEDVTAERQAERDRQELQARLVEIQRLESIGTLAGGVAHDINNPLSVILNCADLIAGTVDPGGPVAERAREIVSHGERIAGIVRNLLAFAQAERRQRRPVPVAEIVRPAVDLLRAGLEQDGVVLRIELAGDLPALRCHRQQMRQVLVNLLSNARDALNERFPGADPGKAASVRASRREVGGRDGVRLTVENHGTPIPPDIRHRLFEPFFTTKTRGIGTGLGLSASLGIVAAHGGTISFEGLPDGGTAFHVDLPIDGRVGADPRLEGP